MFPEGTLNGGINSRDEAKEKTVMVKFPNNEELCQKQNLSEKVNNFFNPNITCSRPTTGGLTISTIFMISVVQKS